MIGSSGRCTLSATAQVDSPHTRAVDTAPMGRLPAALTRIEGNEERPLGQGAGYYYVSTTTLDGERALHVTLTNLATRLA